MNLERMIGNALADELSKQPWWRRYAGTATMAATMIVTLGTWVTTTYADLPSPVSIVIGAVVAVAGVVAARAVPNGITPRGNEQVEAAIAGEVSRYEVRSRDVATMVIDPMAEAVARGFSEHDPRYIGMTTIAAARAYLANLGDLR